MSKLVWLLTSLAKAIDSVNKNKRVEPVVKTEPELPEHTRAHDPLDPVARTSPPRGGAWKAGDAPAKFDDTLPGIELFPVYIPSSGTTAMDAAVVIEAKVGDNAESGGSLKGANGAMSNYQVPELLQQWYASQGFIGYQACAIIAQHWLVDKACSMSGEDAIRNGWELKTDGKDLDDVQLSKLRELDTDFRVKANLEEFNRFRNIFGIRVAIFQVESDDPQYYEKPFNVDGIVPGSYQGISQVDPYWMTPMMTSESTSNPAAIHFYDPEFWVISGRKYHRSHLIIGRGPQPADILKPTYIFGGIPLTQRIYERVYAAERTANEAPLLALSKRTTTLHVDVDKAMTNEQSFVEKLLFWIKYRDNHAVKVLGKNETMEQFDTNLSDFDSVIMNQYQLVSSIAKTPATKLLGTSPKGFNATGEFETTSYHEELESIQEHVYDPMLDRHYLIALRSLEMDVKISVVWNPVDSISTKERADLNDKKADTDQKYITMGAVSPEEVRQRLRDDKHSGYNRLSDETANDEPGMSPENIAAFEKAGAESEKAAAELAAGGVVSQGLAPLKPPDVGPKTEPTVAAKVDADPAKDSQKQVITGLVAQLVSWIDKINDEILAEGQDLAVDVTPGVKRSTLPSVIGAQPNVHGAGSVVPTKDIADLDRIKVGGLIACIENPRNSIRHAKDGSWKIKMPHHYGFIKGSKGADGDEVDCFIGPNLKSNRVFVINQVDQKGNFDEHKCMMGFNSPTQAKQAYLDSYKPGWDGLGSMHAMHVNEFKTWIETGDTTKPVGK